MNELTVLIERWAQDKGLDTADPKGQMLKLSEEHGELAEGIAKGKEDVMRDSIGDMFVVLTILAKQLDMDIYECVNAAYDEIKDRTGEMKNGVFIKSDDL